MFPGQSFLSHLQSAAGDDDNHIENYADTADVYMLMLVYMSMYNVHINSKANAKVNVKVNVKVDV